MHPNSNMHPSCRFHEELDMGTDSPCIKGIKATVLRQEEGDSTWIVLDADVFWDARCNIGAYCEYLGGLATFKIKKFSLEGMLRIIFYPDTGTLKLYFLSRPEVNVQFGGTLVPLNFEPAKSIICRKLEECLFTELEKLEPYDVMKEPICSQCLTLIPSQQQVSPRVFVRDIELDEVYSDAIIYTYIPDSDSDSV